jgi:hypothetical protein
MHFTPGQGTTILTRDFLDALSDFSHQLLDLLSIGSTEAHRQLYDRIHISLNDALQLDIEHQQPKLKKARTDFSRPQGVQAGKDLAFRLCQRRFVWLFVMNTHERCMIRVELERIQDGGASNPTVRYSQA